MSEKKTTYDYNYDNYQKGLEAYNLFEEETKNPKEISTNLLMRIVKDAENTEYGKKYNFAGIKTIEDYQKQVPVTVYDDITDYIEKIKNGNKDILTPYELSSLLLTSGTDKNPKAIPFTKRALQETIRYSNVPFGVVAKFIDKSWMNGHFFSPTEASYSVLPSGIILGSASSVVTKSASDGLEPYCSLIKGTYTSPAVALIPHEGSDSVYVHVRFALMQKDMTGIICAFASYLAQNMLYVYEHYQMLIDDIEKGTISKEANIDDDYRQELMKIITPMPERAEELRKIFENGPDIQFMPLIWPNIKFVRMVAGDGFATYTDLIKNRFLGEETPIIYSGVVSSEGIFSQPMDINNPNSVLCVGSVFMEFLPTDTGNDFSQIKTIDQVEVGKDYELIITNQSGLYRYRIGDVVRITGYHNATPTVEFRYRANKTINIAGEKTTESAIRLTCEAAAKELGIDLLDYEVYADKSSMPAKYIFLIETYDQKRFEISNETLAEVIHKHLCVSNPIYEFLSSHFLPPVAYFEQPETQFLYKDLKIMKGTAPSQVKPVHVITNEEQRKFFFGMIESK